jgi:lysophospholipase L1-like esterase
MEQININHKKTFLLNIFLLIISIILITGNISLIQAKNEVVNKKIILNGKRILILGDSITQDGTYVSYIDYYLEKMFPQKKFDIISIGLSSETASGLSEPNSPFPRPCIFSRVDSALEIIKPDIVVACYGMNDGIYYPQSKERFQAFKSGILKLVKKIKAAGAKIIMLTPPVFDPLKIPQKVQGDNAKVYGFSKPYYKYDNVLWDYSKWIMSLHIKDLTSINLHGPMKEYLEKRHKADPNFFINKDGVHPTHLGHLLMAQIFLRGIGIPIHSENLDKELSIISSDTLFSLINEQRQLRSKGWLEYIGYTRRKTIKTNNIRPTEDQVRELQKQINIFRQKIRKI